MNKRRIFIAINLPPDFKKRLLDLQKNWPTLPARWTKEDNLHLTVVFIGYVNDDETAEICRITREIAANHRLFKVRFEKVTYGPPGGTPRMIWAEGEADRELAIFKNDLEDALLASPRSGFDSKENRRFKPHLTLARMKEESWRDFSPKPEIDLEIDGVVRVETVEVMESELSPKGPTHTLLESAPLKGKTTDDE